MAEWTGAGGATGGSADANWDGGGGLTDDFVTITTTMENTGSAGTLATLLLMVVDANAIYKTGLGIAWAAGETKSATITVTWSSVY
jgi:hypothetical protein